MKIQQKQIPKWWIGGVLLFSFIGFLDSAYLAAKYYLGGEVPCSLVHGCEEVLGSSFADLFGVPIALFGVFYYLSISLFAIAFIDRKKFVFLKAVVVLPIMGFFFTIWLIFVQAVLLEAFCLYCLISAGATSVLFALSVYYLFYGYRKSIG
jgi:uncharacterized membrane protein